MSELGKIFLNFADDLIQLVQVMFPNVPSLVTAGTVIVVMVRMYKKWNNAKDDRLNRLESKIDAVVAHLGVDTCANTLKNGSESLAKTFSLSRAAGLLVRCTKSIIRRLAIYLFQRRKAKMSKFKSRKFILAVVSAILIILNDGLDMGIDSETVLTFAGLVATWIVGESTVDAVRAKGAKGVDYSQSDEVGP